jgi:predicted transcriptional regulator
MRQKAERHQTERHQAEHETVARDTAEQDSARPDSARPDSAHPGDAGGAGRRAAGELAAAVLAVLQEAGSPLSPGDVRERIGGDLAYTTVVTILSRLHAKGVLDRRKSGRAYLYAPVADSPGLAARRMTRVLDEETDREAVLARFVSALSPGDEDLLRRMLTGLQRGDPSGSGG